MDGITITAVFGVKRFQYPHYHVEQRDDDFYVVCEFSSVGPMTAADAIAYVDYYNSRKL